MSNPVAPVWRPHGKSHWACPAQGVVPSIAPPVPTSFRRTLAIVGEAHPQSVMALPVLERTTQLLSTAPPSIFTQVASKHTSDRNAGAGFILEDRKFQRRNRCGSCQTALHAWRSPLDESDRK